ncbi:MAG: hypothetical protein MR585_08345, partial [Selenomonas bovis]|nr:hypothetical protein [Selenomonas bovis]
KRCFASNLGFSAHSPAVQHLFHRFAVPLLLRRRYVLIHLRVSSKILAINQWFLKEALIN